MAVMEVDVSKGFGILREINIVFKCCDYQPIRRM
jgi:hypothetical protein